MLPENIIICGNCIDIMKSWDNKSIDLVITSPPYNTGDSFYGGYGDDLKDEEYLKLIEQSLQLCLDKSRYVFWNMQYITSTKKAITFIFSHFDKYLKDIFIWEKNIHCSISKCRLSTGFEFVFIFGENNSRNFEGLNFGYVPNIKIWHKHEHFDNHHATYPLELPEYFIKYFSFENDIILDPFCGTGTTCLAAKKLKRKYIGIDLVPEYCSLTRKRLGIADNKDYTKPKNAMF